MFYLQKNWIVILLFDIQYEDERKEMETLPCRPWSISNAMEIGLARGRYDSSHASHVLHLIAFNWLRIFLLRMVDLVMLLLMSKERKERKWIKKSKNFMNNEFGKVYQNWSIETKSVNSFCCN